MSDVSKPRVVKDYEKLDEAILEQIKLTYPAGFEKHLIKFTNREGRLVSALPFDTEEKYYLVRMTLAEAREIIEDDDDYDDDGFLTEDAKTEYEENHDDIDAVIKVENGEGDDDTY